MEKINVNGMNRCYLAHIFVGDKKFIGVKDLITFFESQIGKAKKCRKPHATKDYKKGWEKAISDTIKILKLCDECKGGCTDVSIHN